MSNTASSKQIRPKVRSKKGGQPFHEDKARLINDDDSLVEEAMQRMENWMGLSSGKDDNQTSKKEIAVEADNCSMSSNFQHDSIQEGHRMASTRSQAKSILRKPKYTKQHLTGNKSTPATVDDESQDIALSSDSTRPNPSTSTSTTDSMDADDDPPTIICKDIVVERDPTKPMLKRKVKTHTSNAHNHSAVEGYIPSSVTSASSAVNLERKLPPIQSGSTIHLDPTVAHNHDISTPEGDDSNPLILNSLEDLFQAAGEQLPQHDSHRITPDTKLLEADIAFSVMTQEDYDGKLAALREQHEEERRAQLRVFLGTDDVFNDDKSSDNDPDNSDEDEDDLLDILMGVDDENEDDFFDHDDVDNENQEEIDRAPRPFRLLWETLSEWMTPEAVQYIIHLTKISNDEASEGQWISPKIERSDIEASRCAGLMAMVKLYLPKSLEELSFALELRRTADMRLGELLRMFNYVQDAPKLPVKLWKAMTCILLEIVLVEQHKIDTKTVALPSSIASIDMTFDEYRYLTRSAVKSFGVP